MCSKTVKKLENFHVFNLGAAGGDPLLGAAAAWGFDSIQHGTSQETKDKWIGQYADLHYLGGGLIRSAHGLDRREKERADKAAAEQEAYLKMQYAPLAPEKTAMEIGDAIEIRDRRRRAVLLGINLLKSPPGPGIATGGGSYSTVSGSLY